jgi:hypothetical protein
VWKLPWTNGHELATGDVINGSMNIAAEVSNITAKNIFVGVVEIAADLC